MALTSTEAAELKQLIGVSQTAHLNMGLYTNPNQYDREDFDSGLIAADIAQRSLDAYLKGLVSE